MHGSSLSRLIRAGVFAAVCVGVSAVGHASQSEHELSAQGALVGFAMMFAAGWALSTRERGGAAITAWMLWGQLALHFVFSAVPEPGPHPSHPGAALTAAAAADASAGMLAAHVAAALVCAVWLRRGEAAAFTLAHALRTLLAGALWLLGPFPTAPYPRPEQPRRAFDPQRGTGVTLRHVVVRRGPPVPRFPSA